MYIYVYIHVYMYAYIHINHYNSHIVNRLLEIRGNTATSTPISSTYSLPNPQDQIPLM